ncbi:MAG: hypothetical protein ACRDSZ_22145 [Pseudonocardiaceae bacterium]
MSGENRLRKVIPSTCTRHGDARGFTNLVVRRLDEGIELDPHAVGGCVIILDERGATALFDLLGEWLG